MHGTDFRFVDLFAGIGGMRLAFEQAGGTCVYSVEWDRFARTTYAANFEEPQGGDIRDVPELPGHEVLLAGFPCQPFSIAGVSKKQSLGRPHGFLDPTQGTLFFEIARFLQDSQPQCFLLENVRNLLRHDQGRTFRVICETLDNLGYEITTKVVDARHWVPQHRERIYIVGVLRRDFPGKAFEFPDPPSGSPRLETILDSVFKPKYLKSEHVWTYLQAYAKKHREAGHGFGYGLVGPSDVARTLSARYYKDGSEILVKTSDGRPPRMLTPRECGRLMGFPEVFKIPVSDTQAYRQFGNAVVVPVVRWLAEGMIRQGLTKSRIRPEQLPLALSG